MALQLIKEQDTYADAFRRLLASRGEPAWLRLLRQKSFNRFETSGFPTVKDEDWKYTNVAAIARAQLEPVWGQESASLTPADLAPFVYEEARESTLFFVNGILQKEYSQLQALPAGVLVMDFAEVLSSPQHAKIIREHFERYASGDENGFIALNNAYAAAALVYLPANTQIEAPIHLCFVAEGGAATSPRVIIVAEQNSTATLLETYATGSGRVYLTNGIIDLTLGENAQIHHYKVQRESAEAFHVASTSAELGPGAAYETTTINFGAEISRHGIEVRMDHEGARCSVDGLYMVDGRQHSDTHSVIDHRQPRCASHQLYKGILDGKARAVFNGKVFVRHGAQQTDARQTNKNLLLSPDARVDTKPQLEIFADDVKCAHGAAVGQLDQDELFYLESRGLPPALARNLLTYGFAEEVIEKITIASLKRELDEAVLHRLHVQIDA